jgi:hypothetical protein
MKYLTVIPLIMVLAIGGSKAQSKPIVLLGDESGVWTTSHPEMMRSTPNSFAQNSVLRTLQPLEPLPPLTEFHYEEPTRIP